MSHAPAPPLSASPAPRWVVLKFGGTSVASPERWATIERVARDRIREGLTPVIVCSAVSGVTNGLERLLVESQRDLHAPVLDELRLRHAQLADSLGVGWDETVGEEWDRLARIIMGASMLREVSPRTRARVCATGELLSTRLGAAWLRARGLGAVWVDARDCLRTSDPVSHGDHRRYLQATCPDDRDDGLRGRFAALGAELVVTQGFIARTPEGETALLGRGGSDTSGAYFAAALGAERCEIWTDVPGMYTANPRQIPTARLLRQLDYDEAQEIATTGAKVLHPRCIAPVRRHGIPMHIRSTELPDVEGTVISADAPDSVAQVKAVSAKTGVTLISMDTDGMWQQVGFLADVFDVFRKHGISIDLISTSEMNVTVSLDPTANALDPTTMERVMADLSAFCPARIIRGAAAISLVGRRIRAILHRMAPALELLQEHRIHLLTQAASDLNLTVVVDESQAERLVRRLHALFFQYKDERGIFGPMWRETAGDAPGERTTGRGLWWRSRRTELLALAEESTPCFVYDEESLDEAVAALRSISAVDALLFAVKANHYPPVLRHLAARGLGFDCASPGEIRRVLEACGPLPPERLLYTPSFAPIAELREGLELGARLTLDALHPVREHPELLAAREIFVRLDPGQGHGHHAHVKTAGPQSKFGIAPEELDELADLCGRHGIRVVGLHAHVGSGIRQAEVWAENAAFLAQFLPRFPDVRVLDLGGGLGINDRPGQTPLDLGDVQAALARFRETAPGVALWLEPGRFLVGRAGVLLAKVTQVKRKGDLWYVGVDVGMNTLIRPALYGAWHEIVNLTRIDEKRAITANIVGPILETGDTLGYTRKMPAAHEGDVLLIGTAGAYGRVMSSHYNLREPATERMLVRRPPTGARTVAA